MVHLRLGENTFACGVEKARPASHVTSTLHKLAVTCEDCKSTRAFGATVQRLPEVRGGPYRG